MARIYSHEHFPQLAVGELRRLGRDVLTASVARMKRSGIRERCGTETRITFCFIWDVCDYPKGDLNHESELQPLFPLSQP